MTSDALTIAGVGSASALRSVRRGPLPALRSVSVSGGHLQDGES